MLVLYGNAQTRQSSFRKLLFHFFLDLISLKTDIFTKHSNINFLTRLVQIHFKVKQLFPFSFSRLKVTQSDNYNHQIRTFHFIEPHFNGPYNGEWQILFVLPETQANFSRHVLDLLQEASYVVLNRPFFNGTTKVQILLNYITLKFFRYYKHYLIIRLILCTVGTNMLHLTICYR